MPDLEGAYGPQPMGVNTRGPVRLDQFGGMVITRGKLTYSEMVSRGLIWTATNAAAGLAPGTALTATPTFCLFNPANSGVNLHLQHFTMAWTSGTLGAGKLWHCFHPIQATLPAGTALTPLNNLGGYSFGNRARAFTTITSGLTVPAQGIRIAGTVTALAADAGTSGPPIDDKIDGELIVPPGVAWSPQEIGAAGTTPLVFFSISWCELAVPPQLPIQ